MSFPIEIIPDTDIVYRQVHRSQGKKIEGRLIPSAASFTIREGEDGLSVDWNKHTAVKDIFLRISKTFAYGKTSYKDYQNYVIFPLNVSFVKGIENIDDVVHDPFPKADDFAEQPVEGYPHNQAHSLIISKEFLNDLEIRTKLRDHAIENGFQECRIEEIEKLAAK